MKLPHAPQSLWLSTQPTPAMPHLDADVTTDVAIIGAGITGLTAAYHLRRAGKSVVVIDSHDLAEGVTGHTTAHLTEAIDARYEALVRHFGEDGARLVAASSRAAIAEIERIGAEERIPCGFRRVPGYLFTESRDRGDLEIELTAATRAGVHVSLTNEVPLPFAKTALRFEDQARMHPREYLIWLAERLLEQGVRIFTRTRCVHVHEGLPHRVVTDRGDVHASFVFYAAHTPLNRFAHEMKLTRAQSYVVAFAAAAPVADALFWDTQTPYHYLRTQMVGDTTLLLVGGEDHKTGHDHDTSERYEALSRYARERFAVESIHFMWSSQVIEPIDGLPYIGASPHSDTTFVATGFGGNGMTFGTLAGMMVSDAILGRKNPYAELYSPARIQLLAAAKNFVVENVDVPIHLLAARLRHASAPSVATVAPGEGKIVRQGGQLLAVYRDSEGRAHAVSPKCSHMGCLVEWNRAERTWDCPCHGSRFNVSGEVLTGPATAGLATKTVREEEPPRKNREESRERSTS